MIKDDILNDINGYKSNKGKAGYLTTKKGYYVTGFTTTIKHATQRELSLAESYGVELISKYEKIDPTLITIIQKDRQPTLTTQTFTFEVRTGVMVVGLLSIVIQSLDDNHFNIMYYYQYRTNISNYRKQNNIHTNIGRGKKRYRMSNKNKKLRK